MTTEPTMTGPAAPMPVLALYHLGVLRGYFSDKEMPDQVRESSDALYTLAVQGAFQAASQAASEARQETKVSLGNSWSMPEAEASVPVVVVHHDDGRAPTLLSDEEIELPRLTKLGLDMAQIARDALTELENNNEETRQFSEGTQWTEEEKQRFASQRNGPARLTRAEGMLSERKTDEPTEKAPSTSSINVRDKLEEIAVEEPKTVRDSLKKWSEADREILRDAAKKLGYAVPAYNKPLPDELMAQFPGRTEGAVRAQLYLIVNNHRQAEATKSPSFSMESNDSLDDEETDVDDEADEEEPAAKWAYEGNIIQLDEKTYSTYKRLYPHIDLEERLNFYDAEYARKSTKNWPLALTVMLRGDNNRAAAEDEEQPF